MLNASIALLTAAGFVVLAKDDVPKLDVADSCRHVAQLDAVDGRHDADCLRDEADARAVLVRRWGTFSAASRSQCTAETKVGGPPSYVELLVCLETNKVAQEEFRQ